MSKAIFTLFLYCIPALVVFCFIFGLTTSIDKRPLLWLAPKLGLAGYNVDTVQMFFLAGPIIFLVLALIATFVISVTLEKRELRKVFLEIGRRQQATIEADFVSPALQFAATQFPEGGFYAPISGKLSRMPSGLEAAYYQRIAYKTYLAQSSSDDSVGGREYFQQNLAFQLKLSRSRPDAFFVHYLILYSDKKPYEVDKPPFQNKVMTKYGVFYFDKSFDQGKVAPLVSLVDDAYFEFSKLKLLPPSAVPGDAHPHIDIEIRGSDLFVYFPNYPAINRQLETSLTNFVMLKDFALKLQKRIDSI